MTVETMNDLNVKEFRAKGDGLSSDTAALRRVIDAGGIACIPPGIHLVGTLCLRRDRHLTLPRPMRHVWGCDSTANAIEATQASKERFGGARIRRKANADTRQQDMAVTRSTGVTFRNCDLMLPAARRTIFITGERKK